MDKSKRNLAKVLGAAGGAAVAWKKPVVDAISLPAHAKSTDLEVPCADPGNCINCFNCPNGVMSFDWNQDDPDNVPPAYDSSNCTDSNNENITLVYAADLVEATQLCGELAACNAAATPASTNVQGPCGFFLCTECVCLVHGSQVLLPTGNSVAIETLEIGQLVASHPLVRHQENFALITGILKEHVRSNYFVLNGELRITNDHPVLTMQNGVSTWTRVEDLEIGNLIRSMDGVVELTSMERIHETVNTVYLKTSSGNFVAQAGGQNYVVRSDYLNSGVPGTERESQQAEVASGR